SLDKQANITRQSIQIRKNSLEVTKALKASSFANVNSAAIEQTKAQLYNAQVILLGLQNSIKHLENTFCILLAQHPHPVKRSTLAQQNISTELKTGVPTLLLE